VALEVMKLIFAVLYVSLNVVMKRHFLHFQYIIILACCIRLPVCLCGKLYLYIYLSTEG